MTSLFTLGDYMGDGRAVSDQESNSEGGGGGNRGNTNACWLFVPVIDLLITEMDSQKIRNQAKALKYFILGIKTPSFISSSPSSSLTGALSCRRRS
jgi:hypothetical protein